MYILVPALGYMLLLNLILLTVSFAVFLYFREKLSKFYGKLLGIEAKDAQNLCINCLAGYKILIIVFNLAPYIALRCLV